MISHYRIAQVICFLVLIVAAPATLITAAYGMFVWAAVLLVASIATFIGYVESRRQIKHKREMENRYSHKHIKPI